jgi:hypothetical protein
LNEGREKEVWKPTNVLLATWARRLAYETGTFEPLDVPVPALPREAGEDVHRARSGFVVLVGLRWKDGAQEPLPYSARFCEEWVAGMSRSRAARAIEQLRRHGVIREVGRFRGLTPLYLPGGWAAQLPLADESAPSADGLSASAHFNRQGDVP